MAAFPRIHRVVVSICAPIERCAGELSLRQREPTRPYEVESLEQRRLLSRFNITWDEWQHSSPAFLAEIAALERQYPRFAVLLNADLAALQAESASGAAVAAESAVFRGPLHHPRNHRVHPAHVKPAHRPKPPRHPKPAHNTKPHHPKPHRHGSSVTEALSPSGGPSVTANNFVYDPSLPHQLIFTFNEDVSGSLNSAGMSATSVIDLNTGSSVTPSTYSWNGTTDTATYGFSSALPDSNYAAVLHGSLIYDSSNVHLIGRDTLNGHDYLASSSSDNGLIWFKDADPNRDRSVGNDDASLIAAHYNMPGGYKQGDVDYSGTVNFNDLVIVDRAFGQSLPQLGAPGTPTLTAAGTDRLLISWPASTDTTVTGYDVYRNWQRVATNVPTASFMDTGLSANTSYTYSVVAKDSNGNTSFATIPLVASTAPVGALTVQPVSNQNMNAGGTLSFSTTFADTGPAATHSATVRWGDGNTTSVNVSESNNSGTISGSHTYAGPGPYYGVLTVQGTNGESATTMFPVANLYATGGDGYTLGRAFILTPTLSDPAGNNSVQTYTLSWGDGTATQTYTGSTSGFSHTYTSDASDPYTATLVANSGDGTYTDTPTVAEAGPTLSLSGAASATEGSNYTLNASVADGDAGDTYTWELSWGDGSDVQTLTAPAGAFAHVYGEPGSYTISAIAVDELGTEDLGTTTMSIVEAVPSTSLLAGSAPAEGTDVTLTDTFFDPGGDTLDALSVTWGDSKSDVYTGDPATFDHTFAEAGTYNVTAIFQTEDGTYNASTSVTVTDVSPTFTASGSATTLTEGTPYTLTETFTDAGSNDAPTSYTIKWGDGVTDNFGTSPDYQGTFTHTYTEPSPAGGYSISATLTADDGTYTAATSVTITEAAPTFYLAGIGIALDQQGYTEAAFFSDPGGDPVTGYTVTWGDGTTASGLSHAYTFSTSSIDQYGITATATTEDGTYTALDSVHVDPGSRSGNLSLMAPSSTTEGVAYTLSASFSDSDQVPYGYPAGANYVIAWGDGDVTGGPGYSASLSMTHVYAEAGSYTITVGAEYQDGSTPVYAPSYSYSTSQQAAVTVADVTPNVTITGDTTATVTGDTYTLTPTFSDPGSGDIPKKWTIAWGDGASQVYFGTPVGFKHVYTTASTSGTVYSPSASVVIDDGTYSATTNVTIAQPVLDVLKSDGTTFGTSEKHTTGAYVAVNSDDDGGQFDSSGNPIPDYNQTGSTDANDPDLVTIVLEPVPAAVGGTYTISWPQDARLPQQYDFQVWKDPSKTTPVVNGSTQFDATQRTSLYVEGLNVSSMRGASSIKLNFLKGTGNVFEDFAKLTTGNIVGADYVPAYGTYLYKMQGPFAGLAPSNGWSVTGGALLSVLSGTPLYDGVGVSWNATNGANGWNGTVTYTPIPGAPIRFPVSVFQFSITAPAGAFAEGMVIDGGPPQNYLTGNPRSPMSKPVISGTLANPGLAWKATIAVAGPPGSGARGVGFLRIGFIQNIQKQGYSNDGFYNNPAQPNTPLMRESSSDTYFKLFGPVLDGPTGAGPRSPWYLGGPGDAPWRPSTTQLTNTLMESDLPASKTPLDYEKDKTLLDVGRSQMQLNNTSVLDQFQLDVCAETARAQNFANLVYVPEATATWSFNGSGSVVPPSPYTWTGNGAADTPPSGWAVPNPQGSAAIITGGMIGNDVINAAKFQ